MPDSPQRIAWIGGTVHTLALTGAETDGRLTLLRSTMRAPSASPVHVHRDDDETLMMLDGSAVVWRGADRIELAAGDSVFLPRAVPHAYRILEDSDVMTVCTPAGIEAFFRHAGWDLADGEPPADWSVDMAKLQEGAKLTNEVVLGPPLEPDEAMPAEFHTTEI